VPTRRSTPTNSRADPSPPSRPRTSASPDALSAGATETV
jgi:hypothetical protein